MYADNLLLSASLTKLQQMINVCAAVAGHLDIIVFNEEKSIVVEHAINICVNIMLDWKSMPFAKTQFQRVGDDSKGMWTGNVSNRSTSSNFP